MNKEGSFKPIMIVMLLSLVIAGFWDKVPAIKETVHLLLDSNVGVMLNWNLLYGMVIVVFVITLITSLLQKYATDQKTIKELKEEQKKIQKKAKEFQHDPAKMMEIQKEIMPLTLELMKLSMRPIIYTGVPFILLFRWFGDYFALVGNPKILGMGWIFFYILSSIIFSIFIRKALKIA